MPNFALSRSSTDRARTTSVLSRPAIGRARLRRPSSCRDLRSIPHREGNPRRDPRSIAMCPYQAHPLPFGASRSTIDRAVSPRPVWFRIVQRFPCASRSASDRYLPTETRMSRSAIDRDRTDVYASPGRGRDLRSIARTAPHSTCRRLRSTMPQRRSRRGENSRDPRSIALPSPPVAFPERTRAKAVRRDPRSIAPPPTAVGRDQRSIAISRLPVTYEVVKDLAALPAPGRDPVLLLLTHPARPVPLGALLFLILLP